MSKVLKAIPAMDSDGRLRLFHNALGYIRSGQKIEEAKRVIEALQEVWAEELLQFEAGSYKAPSPKNGILSAVGYHVGERNGVKEELRRDLLDFIMTGILPPVGTPAHYAEWGTPRSVTRYRKLHRVLQSFATSSKSFQDPNESNLIKAGREWNEDLNYIEMRWKTAVS